MNRNLIYHMWVPRDGVPSIPFQIHYLCLSQFILEFDYVTFVLAADDITNHDEISRVRSILSKLPIKGIVTFKLIQNTSMGEALTCYDEIFSKLDELDGITFFAHSKSFSNYHNNPINNSMWITAMYYFNLVHNNILAFESNSYGKSAVCSGTLLINSSEVINFNNWIYSGTFYWINTRLLRYLTRLQGKDIPKPADRGYAENILGNLFSNDDKVMSACDNYYLTYLPNSYENTPDCIRQICYNDVLYSEYLNFHNTIMSSIDYENSFI